MKKHKDWTIEDWNRVIWTDKTNINRLGSNGCKSVWKKKGDTRITKGEIEGTVKFSGGSLMIWTCFTAKGIGYLTKIDSYLNSELYVNILEDKLMETLEFYRMEKNKMVLQSDNDSKHTSRLA